MDLTFVKENEIKYGSNRLAGIRRGSFSTKAEKISTKDIITFFHMASNR
jgi:hypothetical protein